MSADARRLEELRLDVETLLGGWWHWCLSFRGGRAHRPGCWQGCVAVDVRRGLVVLEKRGVRLRRRGGVLRRFVPWRRRRSCCVSGHVFEVGRSWRLLQKKNASPEPSLERASYAGEQRGECAREPGCVAQNAIAEVFPCLSNPRSEARGMSGGRRILASSTLDDATEGREHEVCGAVFEGGVYAIG